MDYKLAKQLKEAEYEYEVPETYNKAYTFNGELIYRDNDKGGCFWLADDVIDEEDLIFIPQLSELIAACGKRKGFEMFEEFDEKSVSYKVAVNYPKLVFTRGKTPEEAVARLWLKLNKK